MLKRKVICGLTLCAWLFFPLVALGDMSSSTYRIYADVISIGSGLSESSTYNLEGTGGEAFAGSITSSTFEIKGGFQYMDLGSSLTLNIVSSSLNLGTLSTTTVSTASTTVYISTGNASGYTLSISSVAGTSVAPISGNSVTAGVEGYGLAVDGANKAFSDDRTVAPRILATTNSSVMNDQLDLIFKASISPATVPGDYSQAVVITASVNP